MRVCVCVCACACVLACACMCACVCVCLHGSIVPFRGSSFSVLLCNFVPHHRVKQRRDSPRRGLAVPLPVSLRILSIVLSSHREYSPILEQNDVSRCPFPLRGHRNHVSLSLSFSRVESYVSRCDRESFFASLPEHLVNVVSTTVSLSRSSIIDNLRTGFVRNLTKILMVSSRSSTRAEVRPAGALAVVQRVSNESTLPFSPRNGIELNLVKLQTSRGSRKDDDRRPPLRSAS